MLLPLMLTLYLGAVEISQGIALDRKVTLTARTVADLVSQVDEHQQHRHDQLLNAATAVMAPFPDANLKVTVSSVKIDAHGKAKIAWSDTNNGTARANGSTVTLPTALNVAEHLADLERGAIHLQADDRLRHHRHADAEGSDLHAAAAVRLGARTPVELARIAAITRCAGSAAPSST